MTDLEHAFNWEQRALLAAYQHDRETGRIFDDLTAAQAAVRKQGEQPRQPHFAVLRESWQMHRGEAFWDRQPAEPTPQSLKAVE